MVRIYYSINTEEPVEAYKNPIKLNCLEMHLWFSSTLKEVAELIKALVPATRSKQKFKFSRVVNHNNEVGTLLLRSQKRRWALSIPTTGSRKTRRPWTPAGLELGTHLMWLHTSNEYISQEQTSEAMQGVSQLGQVELFAQMLLDVDYCQLLCMVNRLVQVDGLLQIPLELLDVSCNLSLLLAIDNHVVSLDVDTVLEGGARHDVILVKVEKDLRQGFHKEQFREGRSFFEVRIELLEVVVS